MGGGDKTEGKRSETYVRLVAKRLSFTNIECMYTCIITYMYKYVHDIVIIICMTRAVKPYLIHVSKAGLLIHMLHGVIQYLFSVGTHIHVCML